VKCPFGHVAIEIAQVWILIYRFEKGSPAVVLRKLLREGAFARTNVASNGYVFDLFQQSN
jgi:hypothetical protein